MLYLPRTAFKSAHLPEGNMGLKLVRDIIHNSKNMANEIILAISEQNLHTEEEVYSHFINAFNCLDSK